MSNASDDALPIPQYSGSYGSVRMQKNSVESPGSLRVRPPISSGYPATKASGALPNTHAKNIFLGAGILLLMLLCIVPVWNAFALLQDANYVFWHGTLLPWWIITLCLLVIVVYVVTVFIFFSLSKPSAQTEQTVMMIANIFITLLGLFLMLISLPLSRQSLETYDNLMHRCANSVQTHRMYEYSQVLQNIRNTPECASKYSVEECSGYEEAKPYTSFLKAMENDFRCSGFCYKPPSALAGGAAPVKNVVALISTSTNEFEDRRFHKNRITPAALLNRDSNMMRQAPQIVTIPATLFSNANYQVSCEGIAARDIKNFAGDIGFQLFYQGVYLVLIAIATGFLKLVGVCVQKGPGTESKLP